MNTAVTSRATTRPYLLVSILVLVNSAGIWGQTGWGVEHVAPTEWDIRARLALALGFAAALELIGVFLARMADQAEAVELPAGGYRLGSYAVGLAVGALNFSHFLDRSVAMAISFGLLSAASPFLWGIYSTVRRGHPAAPSRRFWHPVASVRLIRFMAWEGIASEEVAIARMARRGRPVADSPLAPRTVDAPADEKGVGTADSPALATDEASEGKGLSRAETHALSSAEGMDLDLRYDGPDPHRAEPVPNPWQYATPINPDPVSLGCPRQPSAELSEPQAESDLPAEPVQGRIARSGSPEAAQVPAPAEPDRMTQAIQAVRSGKSVRAAAAEYSIRRATLADKVKADQPADKTPALTAAPFPLPSSDDQQGTPKINGHAVTASN